VRPAGSSGRSETMDGLVRLTARIFTVIVIAKRWRRGGSGSVRPAAPRAGRKAPASNSARRNESQGARERPVPVQREGGSGPDTPADLPARDWRIVAKRTAAEIKKDRVTLAAAGMAYYFFLAIFPALIAAVGIMGLVEADTGGLIQSIGTTLPGDAGQAVTEPFREASKPSDATSTAVAVLGIAVALWSATSGMVALQSALNVAYDVPEDRKLAGKRGVGLLLLVATFVLGGVPSPLFTFGEATIFVVLGWILTVIAVMVLFAVFFYFGPNRPHPNWQWVSVGGVVGGALWITASVIFGFYVDNFSNYSKTYGSLAGVVVLILWLYISSLSVLIGGELNSELERRAARRGGASV
jgi:membrane protein